LQLPSLVREKGFLNNESRNFSTTAAEIRRNKNGPIDLGVTQWQTTTPCQYSHTTSTGSCMSED
jgi:hypothetical protein